MNARKRYLALVAGLLALLVIAGCYRLAGRWLELDRPEHKVAVEKNVMVEMRDGIRLATDIYRPAGPTRPLPVILTRLPYNKNNVAAVGRLFAERGYVMVIQDCRACFASEGEVFVPIMFEGQDGSDTVDWISRQAWFNGELGTWGPSYLGITQWAIMDHPLLRASYPQITSGRMNRILFHGGAFYYRLATGWSSAVGKQNVGGEEPEEKSDSLLDASNLVSFILPGFERKPPLEGGLFNLPLKPEIPLEWEQMADYSVEELAEKLGFIEDGKEDPRAVERMIEVLNYPAFAEHSNEFNFKDRYREVRAPALMISGWFDMFLGGQLEDFVNLKKMASGDAAQYTRLIIGPWGHVTGKHPAAGREAATSEMIRLFMLAAWFDRWLKGEDNGIEKGAPITLYVMGKNVWREEREWPLARTRWTRLYLHSGGNANTRDGDGTASFEPPGIQPTDRFRYDPMDPVITAGGNNLLESVGARDQKEIEKREDVLVYTSEPLEEDLEITGPITAVIYASSSAVDTDFTVKLCDVYPNGKSLNVADGIVRARYRESLTEPSLLEPGKVYRFEIDLWATSTCFLKGHRIRVQISSSNFPRFDRNANAGGQGGPEHYVVADQTIYHDQERPSHLVLPVIP